MSHHLNFEFFFLVATMSKGRTIYSAWFKTGILFFAISLNGTKKQSLKISSSISPLVIRRRRWRICWSKLARRTKYSLQTPARVAAAWARYPAYAAEPRLIWGFGPFLAVDLLAVVAIASIGTLYFNRNLI